MATVRHLGLFPWCTTYHTTQDIGAGTLWPIGLTTSQMLKFYWLIKKIKLTSEDASLVIIGEHTDSFPFNSERTEKSLVCAPTGDVQIADGLESFNFFEIVWSATLYEASSSLFYPYFRLQFVDQELVAPTRGRLVIADSYWKSYTSGTTPTEGGVIDCFGAKLSMGYGFSVDTGTGSAPQRYGPGAIAAEEYWPYDPGDGGGPIYDTTTGKQLRPFPS
jgi:hypothetical protein